MSVHIELLHLFLTAQIDTTFYYRCFHTYMKVPGLINEPACIHYLVLTVISILPVSFALFNPLHTQHCFSPC